MKSFIQSLTLFASLSLLPFCSLLAAETETAENPVVARVNGVNISMQEVRHFMQQQQQQQQVSPEQAVMEMVNIELLVQAATNAGMMQDETLALEIKRSTSGLIASHYLNNFLSKLEIGDEELLKRYEAQYKAADQGLEYNANHILLETEEAARAVIKQLDEGADFSALAKEKSTGPSGKSGGVLGWFQSGDMVAPFSEATQQLKPGQYSTDPVQTQFGWHVILLNETRKTEPPAFESVKKELSTAVAAESIRNMIKALHDQSTIEFNPE